jgi:hypothetical protein
VGAFEQVVKNLRPYGAHSAQDHLDHAPGKLVSVLLTDGRTWALPEFEKFRVRIQGCQEAPESPNRDHRDSLHKTPFGFGHAQNHGGDRPGVVGLLPKETAASQLGRGEFSERSRSRLSSIMFAVNAKYHRCSIGDSVDLRPGFCESEVLFDNEPSNPEEGGGQLFEFSPGKQARNFFGLSLMFEEGVGHACRRQSLFFTKPEFQACGGQRFLHGRDGWQGSLKKL